MKQQDTVTTKNLIQNLYLGLEKKIEKSLRELREFGRLIDNSTRFYSDNVLQDYDSRYISNSVGFNVRMTDIAASLGKIQLKKLDSLNETFVT